MKKSIATVSLVLLAHLFLMSMNDFESSLKSVEVIINYNGCDYKVYYASTDKDIFNCKNYSFAGSIPEGKGSKTFNLSGDEINLIIMKEGKNVCDPPKYVKYKGIVKGSVIIPISDSKCD